MKKIFFCILFFAAFQAYSQYERQPIFSYHVGIGFSPYNPPISAWAEMGGMVTTKMYFGGQVIWRATNAPTLAVGFISGFLHSWNDRNMRELTTGFYMKAEFNALVRNNDAFKNDPAIPVGIGIRHYWDDFVFVDLGRCQGQTMLTLGIKLGRPVYW